MTSASKRARKHWASRPADFQHHDGRSFWRVPHDHQRLFTEFWFSETGPYGAEPSFDVRRLPGYAPFRKITDADMKDPDRYFADMLSHYGGIICGCVNDGVDLLTVAGRQPARHSSPPEQG